VFKQQLITAVERESSSIVVQVSDPPAAQRDQLITQISQMCTADYFVGSVQLQSQMSGIW